MSNLTPVIKSIQDIMRQDAGVDGDAIGVTAARRAVDAPPCRMDFRRGGRWDRARRRARPR